MSNKILTFGCRLNTYESEVIRKSLGDNSCDNVIVFNGCAVTSEAERQLRQAIRKAKKENPDSTIVVTGCAAQISPEKYAEMPEVDFVVGNEEKMRLADYLNEVSPKKSCCCENCDGGCAGHKKSETNDKVHVSDIMASDIATNYLISSYEERSRAFVQVQNGCNHRCTYCIIPYGRGNSRSVPLPEIIQQVQQLYDNGYSEIVITGVDITDYGLDFENKMTFAELLKEILKAVPQLSRLRISSIDVAEVDNELFDLITKEPRILPHIHISLQAGDDMVLTRMRRRHTRQQVIDFCKAVRKIRPEIAFGADIIAGFPTETDEMFTNTLNLISEAGIVYGHIFPYSMREGTPAAKMPQVLNEVKKERAKKLRDAAGKELLKMLRSMVGSEQTVMIEQEGFGKTNNFAGVKLMGDGGLFYKAGEVVKVKIEGVDEGKMMLVGRVI